ncbi:hypothetical protein METHPM2_40026 [Pseudomonas sp. PM2]|uniref:Uncharacterized protein n=1 Tax=Pseudomonas fluorescens TaxID=294 RepID=A0A125QE05_PSEFL|nr:hypothetical protein PFL603g_03654 [Pseudomonas fluorescens]
MLAKNVNDDAGMLKVRGVRWFFASKLAPTHRHILSVPACALYQLKSARLQKKQHSLEVSSGYFYYWLSNTTRCTLFL